MCLPGICERDRCQHSARAHLALCRAVGPYAALVAEPAAAYLAQDEIVLGAEVALGGPLPLPGQLGGELGDLADVRVRLVAALALEEALNLAAVVAAELVAHEAFGHPAGWSLARRALLGLWGWGRGHKACVNPTKQIIIL